jgi:cyclase
LALAIHEWIPPAIQNKLIVSIAKVCKRFRQAKAQMISNELDAELVSLQEAEDQRAAIRETPEAINESRNDFGSLNNIVIKGNRTMNFFRKPLKYAVTSIVLLMATLTVNVAAQDVKIGSTDLGGGIYMLTGEGGNIGVFIGADGTFMVDDQMAHLTPKILVKIKELGGGMPRFILNTHFHFDHTGGNENFGNSGVTIVSHDNARKRLVEGATIKAFKKVMPPAAKIAVPVITFAEDMTFHLNGETVRVFHSGNAHTDGDSIIHFQKSNAIHAGDTFMNGFYPFIDVPNGGTVKGVIAAADAMLELSDDDTKIIPGHGPLGNKAQLKAYRDMLITALKRLSDLKSSGKSAAEAVAENPLSDLDAAWGNGLLPSDKWIMVVYGGLQ